MTKRQRNSSQNTPATQLDTPSKASTQLSPSNSAADASTQDYNVDEQFGDELQFGLRLENARDPAKSKNNIFSHEEDLKKLFEQLYSITDLDDAKRTILPALTEA